MVPEQDVATFATPWCLSRQAGEASWENKQTGQSWGASWVGWQAGLGGRQGRVTGRIGWRSESDGGPDGWRGMDQSKEFSGVNIFTLYLISIFNQLHRIFDFMKE